MTRKDVDRMFADFDAREDKTHEPVLIPKSARIFETNAGPVMEVSYWPWSERQGFFSRFEYCSVYFDTNQMIVGCDYSGD